MIGWVVFSWLAVMAVAIIKKSPEAAAPEPEPEPDPDPPGGDDPNGDPDADVT